MAEPRLRDASDDRIEPASRRRLGFLLLDEFSMLALTAAIEPMRAANRKLGREAYGWRLIGDSGADGNAPVRASSGIALAPDLTLSGLGQRLDDFDALFVVTGLVTDPPHRARAHAVLRQAARAGLILGSLSAGAFVLARAGLLDGHRCTVHWEYQPAFEDAFPEIPVSPGLFVIDRRRWTGSGGIASLDMMLHVIGTDHGATLAREIGNNFQVDRIRNAAIVQRPGDMGRLDNLPAALQRAVELMLANVENPWRMEDLAAACGLNLRRMERLFQRHLDDSPAQFYRRLRLERARELLAHTDLSTLETAMLTGFSSSSHFASAYLRHFGSRPSATRRKPPGQRAGPDTPSG